MKQPLCSGLGQSLLFIRVWTPECHMWWEMDGLEIPTPYAVFGKPVADDIDTPHFAVDAAS